MPFVKTLSALVVTAVLVPLAPVPARAGTPSEVAATGAALVRSVEPCGTRVSRPDDASLVSRCAVDLTGPDTSDRNIFQLVVDFVYCVGEAAGPDSMYPGIRPSEVIGCMEGKGY
jgi:hypothetical protein